MKSSRRRFLKIAGVAALGAGVSTKPLLEVFGATGGGSAVQEMPDPKALKATQWAMVIDTRRLNSAHDLEPMIEACHKIHNVPHFENIRHEIKWIWEVEFHNAFPTLASDYLAEEAEHRPYLVLCNHCTNPPCVRACPTKATFKRPSDGIVIMDMHRCIGCRFCMAACPYGARSFNFRNPRPFIKEVNLMYPRRAKGVVEKCNFCAERIGAGQLPACVEASNGALAFGDLGNPQSEVRELLREHYTIRRKAGLGTGPNIYYIV